MFRTVLIAALVLAAACINPPPPDVGIAELGALPPAPLVGPFFGAAAATRVDDGAVAVLIGTAPAGLDGGDEVEVAWRQTGNVNVNWAELAIARGEAPLGSPKLAVVGALEVTTIMETQLGLVAARVPIDWNQAVAPGDSLWAVFAIYQGPGFTTWPTVQTSAGDPIAAGAVASYRPPGGWRPSEHLGVGQQFAATTTDRPPIVRGRAWILP